MIKLIQQGLFGTHLVPVSKPLMVRRYNACLEEIGLQPTSLTSFHIDGWGWSPEIAEEQDNRFYMSHGMANIYGIIITPEQRNASLYLPYHTFDWDVHKMIFDQYLDQITDLTAQSAVWFELDQDISAYRNPSDLLMMEFVKVRFKSVGNWMQAAQEQRALISEFNANPIAWMDEDLRQNIINSSREHGDLRFRKFELPELSLPETDCFYTEAFNGAFVFKNNNSAKPLLVLKENNSEISGEMDLSHVEFNLNDPKLITHLYNHNYISDSLEYYFEHKELLELQVKFAFAEAAFELDPNLALVHMNDSQKKGVLNKLIAKNLLKDWYFELENLSSKIQRMSQPMPMDVSDDLRNFLLHPVKNLKRQEKIVVWQLLSALKPYNPIIQYLFDKNAFYNAYKTWPERKQDWVIKALIENRKLFYNLVD
ncbi:hypothetical protein GYB22_05555 [bacterium]|nr:hypothetical protein [bacterium]